eukprot:3824643-Ditylum_brightwellii.AAC.1
MEDDVRMTIAKAFQWVQINAETSTHILSDTHLIPHMEGKWIPHLQDGMNYIGMEIHHKFKWVYPKQRKNNIHIMDVFLDSENIEVEELHPLNYVRYFNKATTLAEITTSDGTRIRPEFLQIA